MFIFLSWIIVIILSIVLFTIGACIKGNLIRYLDIFSIYTACIIGLIIVLAILLVIFGSIASLSEVQIVCGGKEIDYRSVDFISASMFHWFITTSSYSGFIFLFLNTRFS
ncbi:hypothetical protein KSF78_0004806 [Schistosoma japonicum]|nr:hypothetical protein KSF78_0004806 [Schistosoma japonicum]KAH8875941.1 hypothetical protein KSF78_0004806 [Schistosoma japonicum]